VVVDYGIGNIFSVRAALRAVGFEHVLDTDGSQIASADVALVPGVAAFGAGLQLLRASGQAEALSRHFKIGKPLVGLCLGAQMFVEQSEEDPSVVGLGFVKGSVVRLDAANCIVPNQGWLNVSSAGLASEAGNQLVAVPSYFYFSHSYRILVSNPDSVVATAQADDEPILAIYRQQNVTGVQFHPELSGPNGLAFLSRLMNSLE
jgi:imidazole glycerol-phosphate synthase subunit HisH